MKKSLFLAAAVALFTALSMTSCVNGLKEEQALPATGKQMTLSLTLPGDGAATRATFEENIEGGVFKGLKAKWEAGDEVTVGPLGGPYVTFQQTGALSDDGKTASFSGSADESWTDGKILYILYPKLPDGDNFRVFTSQDGTLASLPALDDLQFTAQYTDGGFSEKKTVQRSVSYLRLPEGFALCPAAYTGNVSLEISGEEITSILTKLLKSIKATGDNTIKVGPVAVSGGRLTSDLYVAFEYYGTSDCVMDIAVTPASASWSKHYQFSYAFQQGQMCTVTNVTKLNDQEPPLTLEAIYDETTIGIQNPLGLVISYMVNGGDLVTSTKDNTDEINIAVNAGDKVQFFGDNDTYCDGRKFTNIRCTKDCYVYGNIMSLVSSDNYEAAKTLSGTYTFSYLFRLSSIMNHTEKELKLPATTLTDACYSGMFYNTKLTKAPALPAEELKPYCYWGIFGNCYALTDAPDLPAMALETGCYKQMFGGCSSLEKAPALNAATLVQECYYQMFGLCKKLTEVTCLATSISATDCTKEWLYQVADEGTFTKVAGVVWPAGVDGIPSGWVQKDAE